MIVLTTLPAEADAGAFAVALVEEHLAACVNVSAEMESVYHWKDQVERDRERQIVIKTTESRVSALAARFRNLHPYELPEFVVLPIVNGSEGYLKWLVETTRAESVR